MLTSNLLYSCKLCPHRCGVNRHVETGYCNTSYKPIVSAVFLHKGEEPVLSGTQGVCNVFFAHCNLQCTFCQNHQISRNNLINGNWILEVDNVVNSIIPILDNGVRMLGFVSPTHQVIQMLQIIECLHKKGHKPTVIYNSNCYDNVDTLRELEGVVDVYLPDFKYVDSSVGLKFSGVFDYFDKAKLAIKEMYRQKGTALLLDDEGLALSGLIIRHLVLPNHALDSISLLRFLSDEFSPRLHISLMSQYYPPVGLSLDDSISRSLEPAEYESVLLELESIGFRGWAQSLDSHEHYRPDFSTRKPFSS